LFQTVTLNIRTEIFSDDSAKVLYTADVRDAFL
jgi:hypothetical protein